MTDFWRDMDTLYQNQSTLSMTLTVLAIILTLTFLWFIKRKPSSKKNILIMGTSNSGKTTIFCQLVHKRQLLTQISITPNHGVAVFEKNNKFKGKQVDLIDLPGQDKIRRRFFSLYKRSAKGIIFVLDSSSFHKESKDVAQFLFDILTDEHLVKAKPRILIVCNKQDNEFAKGESYVRGNLEKEIELLRKISSSALKSIDNSDENNKSSLAEKLCGNSDASFEFKGLRSFQVEFTETNSMSQEGLMSVIDWLRTHF